ncbi:MAG: hypothetical protein WCV86_01650 [Patescibacteria group bacterium]|jgi:hypothetical protein
MRNEEKNAQGLSPVATIIVVVVVLAAAAGVWLTWRSFSDGENDEMSPQLENAITAAGEGVAKNTNTNSGIAGNANTNEGTNTSVATNNTLAGTWISDCLVPDEGSAWSERHQFVIQTDGTATHTRWASYDHTCGAGDTTVTDYQYTIPQAGQINLFNLDLGETIFDIYQITDTTLLFGHGFQAHYPAGYDTMQGSSANNRFSVLNTYIAYHKQ